jgi:3-phosphoshikimate 1-carboxyvinyltransferase
MGSFLVNGLSCVKGVINLAGDKSIAHRLVILSALAEGKTTIQNFPANADCLSTLNAFKKLGIKVTTKLKVGDSATISILGKGLWGLNKPKSPIFISGSGTTLRLLLGVLAGQDFKVKLLAGKSLSKRPMFRVIAPLRMMGAKIKSEGQRVRGAGGKKEEYPPITIEGGNLKAIAYRMPVASAQVKSAILLAGLYTRGITKIIEPIKTRDHTERMLKLFKANIKVKGNEILIKGDRKLVSPRQIYIPGDLSSASFFIVLALILPNSEILIRKVNLNPSRMGMVKVLKRMGADIQLTADSCQLSAEPMGDILVRSSKLKCTRVKKEEIPSLIDELPVLMVAACCARGKSIFEAVGELRVKETDRIDSMVNNLRKMGADIEVIKPSGQRLSLPEGDHLTSKEDIIIKGPVKLKGARVKSYTDHRTAMSMFVAGLGAGGKTIIDDASCINKSFPGFLATLKNLTQKG